jgi:hypothetical protein
VDYIPLSTGKAEGLGSEPRTPRRLDSIMAVATAGNLAPDDPSAFPRYRMYGLAGRE